VNYIRFSKEDHLPDWARRDNKVTKGDRVDDIQSIFQCPLKTVNAPMEIYVSTNRGLSYVPRTDLLKRHLKTPFCDLETTVHEVKVIFCL